MQKDEVFTPDQDEIDALRLSLVWAEEARSQARSQAAGEWQASLLCLITRI